MKLRRSLVGCGRTEYLFQLAGRLLASRSLDTVDPGFALPGFGVDSEVNFRHISFSLKSEFHSDLDGLSDLRFDETAAEFLGDLSGRCFVIAVLKPDHEVFPETVRKIHIIDNGNIALCSFLEPDIA